MVLLIESAILMVVIVIMLFSVVFSYQQVKRTPIIEMKLFFIFFVGGLLSFVFQLPLVLLSSIDTGISSTGARFDYYGLIIAILSLIFIHLTLFLPTYKFSYIHTLFLIVIVYLNAMAVFTIITVGERKFTLVGEYYRLDANSLNDLATLPSYLLTIILFVRRFIDIRKLGSSDQSYLPSTKYLILLPTFLLIQIVLDSIIISNPDIPLPTNLGNIFVVLNLLIILFTLRDKNQWLFIIPVRLHGVIIADNNGIVIFSQSYGSEDDADVLLGGLLTALNISLKETLQTKRNLEEISFGDKVIHLAPGKFVTSFLICSQKTLMTQIFASHLTNVFEREYQSILIQDTTGGSLSPYSGFKSIVDQVQQYFAL